MNQCKRCGKENQAHYKFCLGCGGELVAAPAPSAPAAPPAKAPMNDAMAKTVMADPNALPRKVGTLPTPPAGIPAQAGHLTSPTPFTPAPVGGAYQTPLPGVPPMHVAKTPTPGAGLLNPTPFSPGSPSAVHTSAAAPAPVAAPMGGAVAPSPFAAPAPAAAAGPASRPCPNCSTDVPTSFLFCGACGQRLGGAAAAPAPVAVSPPPVSEIMPAVAPEPKLKGRMTLIRPDGSEGGMHEIQEGENRIGRAHGAIFENDGYLSPLHAELVMNAAGAVVRDLDSQNGVFVKLHGETELQPGDVFRIGQELMRFDTITAPETLEDGTEIMGSPNPGYWGRLSVVIGKDIDGSAYPLFGDSIALGRERGDVNFPEDGYVSGLHARVLRRGNRYYLADLGSSNGTFVKIAGEHAVADGTFILLGQQLFRISIFRG